MYIWELTGKASWICAASENTDYFFKYGGWDPCDCLFFGGNAEDKVGEENCDAKETRNHMDALFEKGKAKDIAISMLKKNIF